MRLSLFIVPAANLTTFIDTGNLQLAMPAIVAQLAISTLKVGINTALRALKNSSQGKFMLDDVTLICELDK